MSAEPVGPAEPAEVAELGRLDARRALVFARARLRQGTRRARIAFVPMLQASVGAALAWAIAHNGLGQAAPLFAPIATWVCLGFTKNRVPRKVAELGIGATVGVAVGEVMAIAFGAGWWQIGLVGLIGGLLGRLLDHGELFTMQSAVNGLVIVGMSAYAMPGGTGARWVDALIGALVAFVIAVLVPWTAAERPRRFGRAALEEIARTQEMLAKALRARDIEALHDVFTQLRALHEVVDDWDAVLKTASDIVNLNPVLRAERPQIDELQRMLWLTRRTENTLTMLVRQSVGFTEQLGYVPGSVPLLESAASATHSLAAAVGGWHPPVHARTLLTQIAADSSPREVESDDWRPAALRSLVRALVVDLLQLTGLSRPDATGRLNDTQGAPFRPEEGGPGDEASALWGDFDAR